MKPTAASAPWNCLRTQPVTFDLLMTDVGLPGMDGRTLATRARELRQTLPVLFASGYAETLEVAEGMAVIGKPFSIDQLRAKVKSMLVNV